MIIERDRGTKGWENPCQLSFSRDKPIVCDQFGKIFTALLISYSFPLIAIRVYFHMKQQNCSCSACILPPLLPCALWMRPWDMSAMLRFLLHPWCRSHRATATPSKHFFFFPTNVLLEMNHLPGSKWLIARCILCYWGRARDRVNSCWGKLACNHHVMALDAFKK